MTKMRWVGVALIASALAVITLALLFRPRAAPDRLAPLATSAEQIEAQPVSGSPRVRGKSHTQVRDLGVMDADGVEILSVAELDADLELAGLGEQLVHMPSGSARGVQLVLRRGPSGRVSVAEVFGRREKSEDAAEAPESTPEQSDERKAARQLLDIGPLAVRDLQVRVALLENPLVVRVERVTVRVQRRAQDAAPQLFLSDLHGHLEKPDPLPQPIRIRGGQGVVDLGGHGAVVELRLRVCIGGGELRTQLRVPQRKDEKISLRGESQGALAGAALQALNLFARLKSERLDVSQGSVELTEDDDCARSDGRATRREMEHAK